MFILNKRAAIIALMAGAGLTLIAAAPSPASTQTYTLRTASGCENRLEVRAPVDDNSATAATLGQPTSNAVVARAIKQHATWLSSVQCKSLPASTVAVPPSQPERSPAEPASPAADPGSGAPAQSDNWSGYESDTSYSSTFVEGVWYEPSASVASGQSDGVSVIWPGIGGDCGFTSHCKPLLQDGTIQEVIVAGSNQTQDHYFWFEIVSDGNDNESIQEVSNLIPSAGDLVGVSTAYSPGSATFVMCDYTLNECVQGTQDESSGAPGTSAEWIAERPTYSGPVTYRPLADFGSVTVYDAGFANQSGSIVSPSSQTSPPTWAITMKNSNGQNLATPTGLSGDSSLSTVSMTWARAQ